MEQGWPLLLDLVTVLAAAFVLGAVFERFRQSAVVGYILAGVLVVGFLPNKVQVQGMAELGVALLLFTIGLEFSWQRLKRLGPVGLGGGTAQIVGTIAVTTLVGVVFKMDWRPALVLGAIFALSSTAVVMRVLKERVELESNYGRNAVGILLLQDVALAPLLLLVTFLGNPEGANFSPSSAALTIVKLVVAAALFLLIFAKALPRALGSRAMVSNRELPVLLAVVACIGAAWGAHSIGMSPSLGAFLAGMLLAETPYAEQIRADVGALRTVFVTLFFATIGMLAEPTFIINNLPAVVAVGCAMVVGKAAIAYVAIRAFRQTIMISLGSAIAIAQVGEFSFVFVQIARGQKLFDEATANLVTSGAALSLIAAPWLVWKAPKIARKLARRLVNRSKLIEDVRKKAHPKMKGHILVVGYGETGQAAAKPLIEAGYELLVLEVDHRLVRLAHRHNLQARVGDASMDIILEAAHIATAQAIVVSVPDHRLAKIIIDHAKKLAPGIYVAARARYRVFIDELTESGADCVVDESSLTGKRLGDGVLRLTRDPDDEPFG